MILNVLTDLKSLCGLSPPFLFPNKQNVTEGDFILHTKLSVVRATTVAAQSGCKDRPHHTYNLVTFTQQQQDMVVTSQWLCEYGDKYYLPRLPTNYLQCLFPLRLQKNGVTLGAPSWHSLITLFGVYIQLHYASISDGAIWWIDVRVCKKREKEVRDKVTRSSLFTRQISQNYVSLWGLHLHALWWLYM